MSGHVFAVRFPDDAEGPRVGVRYVGDRVSVQRGLVGDRTDLLDGQLGTRLAAVWEGRLEGFVVAERYVGAGAQASRRLLGRSSGILRRRLRDVLIQPVSRKYRTSMQLKRRILADTDVNKKFKLSGRSRLPFNVHVFFF